jgi:hypothetical protein
MAITDAERQALREQYRAERDSINPLIRFYSYWLEQEVVELLFEVNRLRVQLKTQRRLEGNAR